MPLLRRQDDGAPILRGETRFLRENGFLMTESWSLPSKEWNVTQTKRISVIGAGRCDEAMAQEAQAVGRDLARRGVTLVCGGLGGVMKAACRGARQAGGHTIGILPGTDPCDANPYVEVAIPTGFGEARNLIVVRTGQAVIAIAGEYGTLSEIAHALKMGRPVIGLNTWRLLKGGEEDYGIVPAATAEEAVELALCAINRGRPAK